jgi:hypothetical protein
MAKETALQTALKHCQVEYGEGTLPDIIPVDFGVGVKFKDDEGTEYTTLPRDRYSGIIQAKITSWRGISIGAIHYYAKIHLSDPNLSYIEDGKKCQSSISGSFDKFKPNDAKSYQISVVRELTSQEIFDDPERWECYRVGSDTTMWVKDGQIPWNEREITREILKELKHKK